MPGADESANSQQKSEVEKKDKQLPDFVPSPAPSPDQVANDQQGKRQLQNPYTVPRRTRLPSNIDRHDAFESRRREAIEREQAAAAKEQLMLALRVASIKLNFAQRKAQGAPAPNTIRNQHKVG
jgi:hypothetical protein